MSLQAFYLKEAAREAALVGEYRVGPPRSGMNVIDGKEAPLVFPASLIDYCSTPIPKTQDYFFRGSKILGSRKWMLRFPNVFESSRGGNEKLKYTLDYDYFDNLRRTRFALTPIGDCPWSYRFFEAIMCRCIPVLGDEEFDKFAERFVVFRDSESHHYDATIAARNLKTLIQHHTIAGIQQAM